MRLLDALVPAHRDETRYSFSQWISEFFTFGGSRYPLGLQTTYGYDKAEPISADFLGHVRSAYQANGIISAVELVRMSIFAEARFLWQRLTEGRPGELFYTDALEIIDHPWQGGVTGDLATRMILDADLAGNSYHTIVDGEIVRLRPDWVTILLEPREGYRGPDSELVRMGMRRAGYLYYEGGDVVTRTPAFFFPDEVAHFAPMPDPQATYRGMSWLTPVIREIQSDGQATKHKLKFFENAATPNIAVSLPKELTPQQFRAFVNEMDKGHKGAEHAYKTLYTGGGADVTVIGANMQQLDFKSTQGAGETRIAAAAGVHPVIAGFSEGMAGSSLNAGNFSAARRRFADGTMRPLWRMAAGALETLVPPPANARLWYDDRDIGFLRDDEKDVAEIFKIEMLAVESGIRAGYQPDAVVKATAARDVALLFGNHTNLYSVQLQPPATDQQPTTGATEE